MCNNKINLYFDNNTKYIKELILKTGYSADGNCFIWGTVKNKIRQNAGITCILDMFTVGICADIVSLIFSNVAEMVSFVQFNSEVCYFLAIVVKLELWFRQTAGRSY